MGPILSSLIDLQLIENKVRKTRAELKRRQQVIIRHEKHIQQLRATLAAKKNEIQLTNMQKDKLELEIKARDEEINRMRVALNSAKTNKEYSSILMRINTDKADTSKLEDQELILLNQIDSDNLLCQQWEEEIKKEEEKLEALRQQVASQEAAIKKELDEQMARRQEAYQKVPKKYALQFDRLAVRYDGEVLAVVEKLNGTRGDYSCEGCYMKVPLEIVNSLMTKDDVIFCPNCGRIMVLDMNPTHQPTS